MKGISISKACVGCGLCVKVCPANVFENTRPKSSPLVKSPESCIACGHCEAVCASDAVICEPFRVKGRTCAKSDTTISQLSSLRSIRWYKIAPIPTNASNDIIQAGYNAATAGNNRGVHISSYNTTDIDKLNTITTQHLNKLTKTISPFVLGTLKLFNPKKGKSMSEGITKLKRVVETSQNGEYHIFHNAPHALIIHTPKDNRFGKDDGDAALNNMRIAAHATGYGTCIIGFAMLADKSIAKHFNIPKDHKIHGIITLGEPAIKYSKGIMRLIK